MVHGLSRAVAAGIKSKVGAVVLATLLAAGSATGVAAAATNGAFGQQVKEQVQDCKAQLQSGVHGIGACVSTFAQQHGQQQRQQQQHRKGNPASTPGAHGDSGIHGKPSDPGKPTGTPGNSGGHSNP